MSNSPASRFIRLIFLIGLASFSFSQSTGPYLNVRELGAKGDGVTDDTQVLQNALQQSNGRAVYLPAGKYLVTKPLSYRTTGEQPALKVFGDGISATIIVARLQAGAVIDLDGTGQRYHFEFGGYVHDLTIDGGNPGAASQPVDGIRLAAVWMFDIERVRIQNLSGNAISVPLRTDVGRNPDDYATEFMRIQQNDLLNNRGWGYFGENGLGSGALSIEQNRIQGNAAGGVYTGAHLVRIIGNAIAANGQLNSGGLVVDKVQTESDGLVVEDNEFDSNYDFHIWIKAGDAARIVQNRFNSWETIWKDDQLRPGTHIRLGGAGRAVRDIYISQNYHRSQHRGSGAKGDHDLKLYDVLDANVTGLIERPWIPSADNTPRLSKVTGNTTHSVDFKEK
jgi:hypothetical protein